MTSVSHYPKGLCLPAGGGMNPFGTTWFVDYTNGSDGNLGTKADSPFKTIANAISQGSAGDNIILARGTHSVDVSSAALVPKADMTFMAAVPPVGGKPSTIITHDADDSANLVEIDVDGVSFHGIEFKIVAGGTTAINLFDIAQTTAVNGLVFRDCWFNLNSVDKNGAVTTAMLIDDATNATTGMVIKNCRFTGGDATTGTFVYLQIGVGGIPAALIEDNVFELESADADGYALNFADPGASGKSYAFVVRNNDFIGPKDAGADAVAIQFTDAMTEGEIVAIVRTNYFAYCAAPPVDEDEMNKGFVRNYVGDDDTGGTLVDPGS